MQSSIPAGSTPDASPAASSTLADARYGALTPEAIKASRTYSVATTKTYYGFNCRPRQVKSVACVRDANRVAEALAANRLDPAIGFAYAVRLDTALTAAEATAEATRADYDACEARRMATRDREVAQLLRGKCGTLWRRYDAADDRVQDIRKARDIVAVALGLPTRPAVGGVAPSAPMFTGREALERAAAEVNTAAYHAAIEDRDNAMANASTAGPALSHGLHDAARSRFAAAVDAADAAYKAAMQDIADRFPR